MKITLNCKQLLAVCAIATAVIAAPVFLTDAFAQNPHFVGQPRCAVDSQGNLDCSGKVAGLGNVSEVDAFLLADVQATFGCDNPGPGIHIPPGQPTDFQDLAGEEETLTVSNGRTNFDLSIDVPQPGDDFECPNPNWRTVLVSISYTDVSVCIGGAPPECAGGTDLPIAGTFSRTLIVQ